MLPAMRDMEHCLKRALIVCVGGTRPKMSSLDVAHALESERGISSAYFTIHSFFPENFMVVFDSHTLKDRIVHGGPIKTQR